MAKCQVMTHYISKLSFAGRGREWGRGGLKCFFSYWLMLKYGVIITHIPVPQRAIKNVAFILGYMESMPTMWTCQWRLFSYFCSNTNMKYKWFSRNHILGTFLIRALRNNFIFNIQIKWCSWATDESIHPSYSEIALVLVHFSQELTLRQGFGCQSLTQEVIPGSTSRWAENGDREGKAANPRHVVKQVTPIDK